MENKEQPIHPIQTRDNSQIIGLTKREYFAGLAMQGLLVNRHAEDDIDIVRLIKKSIKLSGELLKQLDNGK